MSQADRRTGSGRLRRLLARVAVVAGATVAGTSAAVVIGSGLSVAEESDGGVLGPVQDRVVEVSGTVDPVLEQAGDRLPAVAEDVPAVVEDVARLGVELPSTPLPDDEPLLDVPVPETLPTPELPAPEPPAPDFPEPDLPELTPHEPEAPEPAAPGPEVPEHAVPAPPLPVPAPAAVPAPAEAAVDAPADDATPTAPEVAADSATDESVSPLLSRFGTAPAPPATGATVDLPSTPSADRTAGLRIVPAHDAGTTTALRTAARHAPGAPRPQPGTTPD